MKDVATLAPALVEALFNQEGMNTGLATLNFEYTTSKNNERHKYHVIVYQEDSGWHEGIQAALKDEE
jgi:hypothetical protein